MTKIKQTKNNSVFDIAKVKDTFGYKGFVKVISLSDFDRLEKDARLFYYDDDGIKVELKITSCEKRVTYYLISFEGIANLEDAKRLKGKTLMTLDKPKVKKGEYHYQDLINLKVSTLDGTLIGVVENIRFLPNQELLEVRNNDNKITLIPFVEEFISKIEEDIIYITPIEGLL